MITIQRGAGGGGAGTGPFAASAVTLSKLGTPTYDDLQDMHTLARSAGHVDGGEITDAGGGNVNVAAGQGLIRATSSDTGTLFTFDWPAASGLAIPTNTIRYVVVEYNAGSPQVVLYTAETYDYRTAFPLGFVVNEAGTLYINDTPHSMGRAVGRFARRSYEVDGRTRAHALGGLILSETGTRNVAVSSGVTWLRGIRDSFPGIDTSVSGTFDRYYRDGVGGWTREAAQTQTPNDNYDNGSGTLAALASNNFGTRWYYLGPANGIAMVYGRVDHNTLAAAETEGPPGSLPPRLQVGSILLGRIIYRKGQASAASVTSAFDEAFTGTAASDHGNLSGLLDDDHPQYVRTTGQATAASAVGSANVVGTRTSRYALEDHQHAGIFSGGVSTGGNTAGDTGVGPGQLVFQGGNNITLSQITGAGELKTIRLDAAAGGGGDAIRGIAAGGSTASTSTVNFSDANGVSFGFGAGGNSTVITASHNALTSQSNQAVSGQNGSFTFQTASFSNANNVSFGTSAGPALTASIPAGATATGNLGGIAGSNATYTSGTVTLTGVGGGITVSSNTGQRIDISVAAPVAQTVQTVGRYALQNTTGQSSSSTWDARSLSFAGLGIVSVGNSGGSGLVISATQSNQAFSADASSTFQTLSLQGNQNFSFSNNAGAIRASHNLAGTSTGFAGANISGSMTHNSSGLNLSLSVAAPGAAAENNWHSLTGNTAGQSSISGSTILLEGGNNITLSGVNVSRIRIDAAGGAAGPAKQWFNNMVLGSGTQAVVTLGTSNGTLHIFPLTPIDDEWERDMTVSTAMFNISGSQTGTQSTVNAASWSLFFGLYTSNNSTQLTLVNSVSTAYTVGAGVSNQSNSLHGPRFFTIHSSAWSAQPVLSDGTRYICGMFVQSQGEARNLSLIGQYMNRTEQRSGTLGVSIAATNTTMGWLPWHGKFSVSTSQLPNFINKASVQRNVSNAKFVPSLMFNNIDASF